MSAKVKHNYLFGPVPSRRLGYSLGVDIIPLKTCTQNCLYCQLGVDGEVTLERKEYVPVPEVLEQLRQRIDEGLEADYITLSGSGEPTLHSGLGELIDGIKRISDIPAALITNGTLFTDERVRKQAGKADVVLPSLDAGDAETFAKINRPCSGIDFGAFVEGLARFRREYEGPIFLEVFFIEGYNTSDEDIEKIKALIDKISPDRIHLNTAVRPTAVSGIQRVDEKKLVEIARRLGPKSEVIADFSKVSHKHKFDSGVKDEILNMLRRRPCTAGDIASTLGLNVNEVVKYVTELENNSEIFSEQRQDKPYYRV